MSDDSWYFGLALFLRWGHKPQPLRRYRLKVLEKQFGQKNESRREKKRKCSILIQTSQDFWLCLPEMKVSYNSWQYKIMKLYKSLYRLDITHILASFSVFFFFLFHQCKVPRKFAQLVCPSATAHKTFTQVTLKQL